MTDDNGGSNSSSDSNSNPYGGNANGGNPYGGNANGGNPYGGSNPDNSNWGPADQGQGYQGQDFQGQNQGYQGGPGYQGYQAGPGGMPFGAQNMNFNPGVGVGQPGGDVPPQIPVMSGPTPFNITDPISSGFKRVNANIGAWLGMSAIYGVIVVVMMVIALAAMFSSVASSIDQPDAFWDSAKSAGTFILLLAGLYVLFIIVTYVFQVAMYRGAFEEIDGRRAGFGTFFKIQGWGRMLGVILLSGVVTAIATVPGIAVMLLSGMGDGNAVGASIALGMFGYLLIIAAALIVSPVTVIMPLLVLDRRSTVLESPARAWTLVKPNFWKVVVSLFLIGLIEAAGAMAFYIGMIYTVPVGMVSRVHLYRQLIGGRRPVPYV